MNVFVRDIRVFVATMASLALLATACSGSVEVANADLPRNPAATVSTDADNAASVGDDVSPDDAAPTDADGVSRSADSNPDDPPSGQAEGEDTETEALAEDTDTAAESAHLGNETIDWTPCGVLECGTLNVPIDYADLDAGTIEIAVNVHRATNVDERIGYLLVNPGGPGQSGLGYAELAPSGLAFSPAVVERFDIVGFDPRGVGESGPDFGCGAPGEHLALVVQIEDEVDTPAEISLAEQAVSLCVESMGEAAALLGTDSVARDMDEIRKALGTEQISYFGASYGSTVGTWYATLFPDSVRAMVVDGADNPVDDLSTQEARIENAIEQFGQFEILLGAALDACDETCPIWNDGDPRGFYTDQAVDKLALVSDAFGGDPAAGALGMITTLYSEQLWPQLWQGLADVVEGDIQVFANLASSQIGTDVGVVSVVAHINCLDQWALQPQFDRATQLGDYAAIEALAAEEFPLLYNVDFGPADMCPFFDTLNIDPLDVPLDGGGVPIVVIGNPSDPATPFVESQELVDETLANGVLVQADHYRHVVYPDNSCVNRIVERVLLEQVYPESGTVCEPEGADEMTAADVADGLFGACLSGVRQTVEGVDPEIAEQVCTSLADRLAQEFDTEQLAEFLTTGLGPAAEAIPEMFDEVMTEFGLLDPG